MPTKERLYSAYGGSYRARSLNSPPGRDRRPQRAPPDRKTPTIPRRAAPRSKCTKTRTPGSTSTRGRAPGLEATPPARAARSATLARAPKAARRPPRCRTARGRPREGCSRRTWRAGRCVGRVGAGVLGRVLVGDERPVRRGREPREADRRRAIGTRATFSERPRGWTGPPGPCGARGRRRARRVRQRSMRGTGIAVAVLVLLVGGLWWAREASENSAPREPVKEPSPPAVSPEPVPTVDPEGRPLLSFSPPVAHPLGLANLSR